MQLRLLCAALALGVAAAPAAAQIRDVRLPPRNFAGAWIGLYTNVDNIFHPGSGNTWVFGDQALALGAALERELTQGVLLGLEASWATTEWEGRDSTGIKVESDADLFTAMATGRLISGGGGSLAAYLKGAIGAFGYQVPDPDELNFDFALSSGAGAEYRFRPGLSVNLEWLRFWAYHEKEGLDDGNTGRHSLLRLGVRFGF